MKIRPILSLAPCAALALAFVVAAPSLAQADEALFKSSGCNDCHYTAGPAREKTIDDQLTKKGPELWYAGSKFQQPWLQAWLQDPKPIRPLAYNSIADQNPNNHPKLDAAGAASMTGYLMSLTSTDVEAGLVKPKRNPKGKLIFTKKMPCSGCHLYPARAGTIGGLTGPSLTNAGARLNPDWILAYLMKPMVFKPIKDMPNFVGLLSEKDMLNVSRFVANFKSEE